jgi:hypothetical protein
MTVDLKTLKATLLSTVDLPTNSAPLEIAIATIGEKEYVCLFIRPISFANLLCNSYLYSLGVGLSAVDVLALERGEPKIIQAFHFGPVAASHGVKVNKNNLEGMAVYVSH